jgi:hypothetical protein
LLATFLIAIALYQVFAVERQGLPSFGRGDTVALGRWAAGPLEAPTDALAALPARLHRGVQRSTVAPAGASRMLTRPAAA